MVDQLELVWNILDARKTFDIFSVSLYYWILDVNSFTVMCIYVDLFYIYLFCGS